MIIFASYISFTASFAALQAHFSRAVTIIHYFRSPAHYLPPSYFRRHLLFRHTMPAAQSARDSDIHAITRDELATYAAHAESRAE